MSLKTYAVTGFSLWIVYGVMIKSRPVIGCSVVSLVLSAAILALKWRYSVRDAARV